MKLSQFLVPVLVLALVLPLTETVLAGRWEYGDRCGDCPGPPGYWRPGPGYWGPGYRGPYREPGYGYDYRGWEYWPYGPDRSLFGDTLSKGEAEKLVQWMIRRNPNLEVGKVTEVENGYKVQVLTRKGNSLVDTLMVEKDTARVYPVYE